LSEDKNLRDLLILATKDQAFRAKFLANPEAIAREYKVKLKDDQIAKIKHTAAFIDSLNDIRLPPGPIFYPVDPILNQWKIQELARVVKYSYIDKWRWIFYPVDIINIGRITKELTERTF